MSTHLEYIQLPVNDRTRKASNSDLLRLAIDKWQDDEDTAPSHSSRAGAGIRTSAMTQEQAYRYIEDNHDRAVRESFIIPIVDDFNIVEKTVKVTVTGEQMKKLLAHDPDAAEKLHRDMRAEHGNSVVQEVPVGYPKPRKAVAAATDGKAVTKYRVIFDDTLRRREVGVAVADTQAEARQKAIALMDENSELNELRIVAVFERDTGDHTLVRVSRPAPETATITVKLTLHTMKKNAELARFMVVFGVHT